MAEIAAAGVAPGIARVQARWDRVKSSALCTMIGNEFGTSVMTIEHLMAAFAGCGIDNAVVELNGPEVPAMDGEGNGLTESTCVQLLSRFTAWIAVLAKKRDDSQTLRRPMATSRSEMSAAETTAASLASGSTSDAPA